MRVAWSASGCTRRTRSEPAQRILRGWGCVGLHGGADLTSEMWVLPVFGISEPPDDLARLNVRVFIDFGLPQGQVQGVEATSVAENDARTEVFKRTRKNHGPSTG